MPARVNKTTGEYVKYIYDATGRKLAQQVFDASNAMIKRSDYIGNLFLENDTLKFNHAEGRIIPSKAKTEANEYQYNLKDHLGNVRLTFTTKDETETVLATLEPDDAHDDRANFLYYDEAIKVRHYWFDHTNNTNTVPEGVCTGLGTMDGNATRLTGGNTDAKFGLAQSVSVMPGDTVNMEVWAKYVDLSQESPGTPIVNFITTLGSAASIATGTFIDGGAPGSLGDLSMLVDPIPHLINDPGNTAPKAYLNFVFLDRDMHKSSTDLGYSQITTDAIEHGQNGCHQKLSLSYPVKQPGYLYIYLSNENPTEVEVFFDDFKVEHIKSPVVQQDDYYPFGLTFNSYQREHSVAQKLLYLEKEWLTDLDLNLYDFEWRQYDPILGRTTSTDPHAESYYATSQYSWALNNPIRIVDNDGMDVVDSQFATTYTGGEAASKFMELRAQSNQSSDGFESSSNSFSVGLASYNYNKRIEERKGGFWSGAKDGFVEGGESTVDFLESLGTTQGWVDLAEGFDNFISLMGMTPNSTQLQAVLGGANYVDRIPQMSAYEIGYDLGFGTEKFVESALLSKGAGLIRNAFVAAEGTEALVATGTRWSKHSLQRLAERGVTKKMAETAIRKGQRFFDPSNRSINYVLNNGFASGKSLLVGTNPLSGQITTVLRSSKNLVNRRFIRIK